MSILIRHGRVVGSESSAFADVLIEGERIAAVEPELNVRADLLIDARGKLVIPGGVDVHTHLDAPVGGTTSSDDFETGTKAAAFGGTTCIIDFATQSRGQSLPTVLEQWQERAKGSCIDYGFHMIVVDLPEERLHELTLIAQAGVSSVKVFTAYPGSLMVDDAVILRIMLRARELGMLVAVHAENGLAIEVLVARALAEGRTAPIEHALTRPPITEGEATHRVISLAQIAGIPLYIVHVTCRDSLEEIAGARKKGYPVFGETCPQYLMLSKDDLARPGFEGAKYVLTPPLRTPGDQKSLWTGLAAGDLQVVSTDHCPFNFPSQKLSGVRNFTQIPNGGPGIEHRLQLLYTYGVRTGILTENQWVDLIATSPAKLFGLYPGKGDIREGADADVVIWDPDTRRTLSAATHHMRVDYSMYEGIEVVGNAETVIARGEVLVDKDAWRASAGRGRYIARPCFGEAWASTAMGKVVR